MNNIENSSSIKENNSICESEWSTRDPLTNELFFIHKNVIYSQLPNEQAKKIISLNHFIQNKAQKTNENKKNLNPENNEYNIKFSNILSGRNINIYGGGAIATAFSDKILDDFENVVIIKNIFPKGIAYIKFICPISCSNLHFGMCSKKDIENNILVKKNFRAFKNTTRRNVIMEINYDLGECVFYLNGEYNDLSLKFKEDAIFPCVFIEKKNTSVILVPSVYYNFSMKKTDFFRKLLILKINVPVVVNDNKGLLKYFNSSFNQKIMVKNIFGEIDEKGILNNFIIFRIEDKNLFNELKKNFSGICTNQDMNLLKIDEIKFLTKNLINKIDFSTKSKKIIINKLNSNFELKDENSITQKILNYIIKNFYTIEFIKDISIEKIENIQNEYIKNGEKMFDFMKEIKERKITENSIIDYLNDNDSLLIIKNNKMKILKRNFKSKFDFSYSQEINSEDKEKLNIIIKTEDLKYFLTNFNFKKFLYNLPSLSKFQFVRNFFEGLKHSFKINNETILLILYTPIQLFSLIAEYLNTVALITKHQKILELSNKQNVLLEKNKNKNNNKPTLKNKMKEKEKKELKNFKEINDVLPFANENENDIDNDNISNDSDINFTYDEYSDYIITDTLKFTKIQKIVNEIISQISIRYNENYYNKIFSEGNLFNSFHNLSSFINYPFKNKQNLCDLVDKGFYVENSFSNELKLIDFDNNKLINTDILTNDENIEKYLNENFPSYLANSSLRNYFRIIDTNYTINNMKYVPILNEEQINNKDEFCLMNYENFKPILITVSKKGIVDIYNYKLGLNKIGNLNILVGLKDINNFSEINEIFWVDKTKLIKNIKDILNNKNFLKKNNNNDYNLNNLFEQKNKKQEKEFKYNEKNFKNLIGMGFSKKSSINALKLHQNNFEKALEYLLENPPLNDNDEKEKEKREENEKKLKIKIEKWQCEVCTFINEKGDLNCEMCESPIPEKILKEFEEKTKKMKEEEEKKKKSEEEKNKSLKKDQTEEIKKPEIIYKYQNVTILKVHIVFNPKSNDSIAPFLLICNFFDHIKSELIIVVYKLMINPLILKDFIKINNNNIISENITNRQFSSIQNAIQYLNQNFFNNLHTLFPLFLGENKNESYKHLIPIEEANFKLNITSYFDSNYYFEKNEIVYNILIENSEQKIEILTFDINNKFKFDSIFNKSLTIVLNNKQELKNIKIKEEIEKINKDEFLTDIKIFADNEKILIVTKSVFLTINKKNNYNLICKKLSEEQIKNFKRINTIYNENEQIKKLEIYDENLKIVDLNLEENKNYNKNISYDSNNEIIIDLDKININDFTENEIDSFAENLDFEKVDLNLSKNPNLNGLTKSHKNNNFYNKFYYNSNKINNLTITLNEPKSIISIELNLLFNLQNTNILNNNNNNTSTKKNFSLDLITNSFDETELFKLNNLIPLTVYDFKGAQSKLSINISRMLITNQRFISNYPKPEYIFTHLNQKSFIVDNIIIGSDINPKSTDYPFGEGLIFITNNIENINIAKEKYSDIKYEELKNILKEKNDKNEDLFEFDPICYVKMNNEFEYFKTSLYKKRIGKFIYFLPLNGRDGNFNKFDTQLMSFLFFGVEGKILNENVLNENNLEEKNNLIDKIFGEKKIIKNSKIEIFGLKENEKIKLCEINDLIINNIIKNNEILGNFYESKNYLNNEKFKKEKFNKIEINLTKISNENFENLSCSFNLISFKNVKNKNNNNSENNLLLNNFNNLFSNSEKFEKFNLILASKISDLNLNFNKRISIINYLSILFEKYNILSEKILTKIDFVNFIKNNLIQSNNDLLSNISFEFLRNCYENYNKIKNIINNNFENILNNLSKLSFTNKGFNQFVNLLNIIKLDKNNYHEKIIHLINKCIEIIKNKNFQIDEQIYLNSYLNINEYPFDFYKFNYEINSLNKKNSSLIPLFYTCLSDIKNETMTLKIDLKKVFLIEKIKLNFSKNQNNDLFNFKINVFSINNNSEQFEIKSFKFYYDHMWKQLKKYVTKENENKDNNYYYNNYYNNNNNNKIIEKKEVTFFGSNDFYSLNFNYKNTNNEFETRYILISISINNSSNENKNFPLNCKIIPVLYGKESDFPNYELSELNKNLNLNISKTLEKVLIDGENYEIKNIIGENSKYLIEYNKKDLNEKKNDENEEIILQTKFINDIQKEKENLKKIIDKIKENKLYNENKEKNKVINSIDSIKNLQNKLNEFNVKSTLEDSLSLNIQIIKILVNELNKLFIEKKINFDLNLNFLQDLLIICVFNEKSNFELENEILKLIKINFEKNEKNLFNNLINFYLIKENENINSFSLIDTFNKLDFNSELLINEIKNNFELEKINEWNAKNFKNNFYKISIFIILLIIKIKNKNFKNLNNIYKICIDCINKLINNKEIKIDFSLINLILIQILNLFYEFINNIEKNKRIENIEIDSAIDFFIEILFKFWENYSIKEKLIKIINLLIDPYDLLTNKENDKIIPNNFNNNEKIVIIIQNKIINLIETNIKNNNDNNNNNENNENETNSEKMDFILNLLNKCYTLNSLHEAGSLEKTKNEEIIKINNSKIINSFVNYNKTSKIGLSEINNFWKNLTNILEKGNLDMMFYDNNFENLIKNQFLKFEIKSQEFLYSQFIKAFRILYKKDNFKLNNNMIFQIFNVINIIIKKYQNEVDLNNQINYNYLLDFINNLMEVLLFGDFGKTQIEKDNKLQNNNNNNINFNFDDQKNYELFKNLFENISNFLLIFFNYSSFSGALCGNVVVFKRSCVLKYILFILSTNINNFYNHLTNDEIKSKEFRKIIKNYLIYLIFNYHKFKTNVSPLTKNVIDCYNFTKIIIENCSNNKDLIEINLIEIMDIVGKVDYEVFNAIKTEKIPNKLGIKIIDKLFNTLKSLLNKFLIDDNITKYFAFQLQGFKFFTDRIISHNLNKTKKLNNINNNNNNNNNYDLNELNIELLKNINNEFDFNNNDSKNNINNNNNKNDENDKLKIKNTNNFQFFSNYLFPINLNNNNNNNLFNYDNNKNNKENNKNEKFFIGDLKNYKKQEFAIINELVLLEGKDFETIKTNPTILNNTNWSSKKKPNTGQVIYRDFKSEDYYEESFYFKYKYPIELKEVLITFNNNISIIGLGDRISGQFPNIYLECGNNLNKLDICVELNKIIDEQYNERGLSVFGFNFFSNVPEKIKNDEKYIENFIQQIVNVHAQYFKFIIRRPVILSNKNTHNNKIQTANCIYAINCVSLIGEKICEKNQVIEFIEEKEKNISIKIISKIFTAEFMDTLKHIAQDKAIIDNIKLIYNSFEPYLEKYANILGRILINVSKYNFELGEWLLNRLLNVDNKEIHAKLAVEITKNSAEYVHDRINKYLKFVFDEINIINNENVINNINNNNKNYNEMIENIGNFINYFCIALNSLLISPFQKIIKININYEDLRNLILKLKKYSLIKKKIMNFISLLSIPNKKLIINENEINTINNKNNLSETLKLLENLYEKEFIYDYLEILSLICNNNEYEKIFIERNSTKFYCEMFINEIDNNLRGKNILFLMNVLKNLSYSKEFVIQVRLNDYDFRIFDILKNKNKLSDTIFLNNNIYFLRNFVKFIRNCISDDKKSHEKLAKILMEDLELSKKKLDKNYVNNVLMPLLKIEKTINVCVHPIDNKIKNIYSSYINLELNNEKEETNENKPILNENNNNDSIFKTKSLNSILFPKTNENKSKSIIPESELNQETQNLFTNLFTNYEYQPGKKFNEMTFKKIFSSKGLDSKKIKENLTNQVSNQGPFLIILYPPNTFIFDNVNKQTTFFFYNGNFPNVSINMLPLDENIKIPYTNQNFVCQISGKKFITASFKSDIDFNTGKPYELGYFSVEGYSLIINITDIINLYLTEPSSSNVNPYIDNIVINKSNEMEDLKFTEISDYEIYIAVVKKSNNDKKILGINNNNNSKIIPIKYIDETGNLKYNEVLNNKYFNVNNPLNSIRSNPIFEIPANVTIKNIKDMLITDLIPFKKLSDGSILENNTILEKIAIENNNILDIYYEIDSLIELREKIMNNEITLFNDIEVKPEYNIINYEPNLPVLKEFEKMGGLKKIIDVLTETIKHWNNSEASEFWLKWIEEVSKFVLIPSFFSALVRHNKCFNIIFNLLCGVYDNKSNDKDIGIEATKYIYEILDSTFKESKSAELRQVAIDTGIFNLILEKLEHLTHEKPRKFMPGNENDENNNNDNNKNKDNNNNHDVKKKSKKGVGYGSDQTGDNKTWDVSQYLEGKHSNSIQIASLINLLTDFFDTSEMKMNEKLLNIFLESVILPCIESAYRGGTLLELAKDAELYYAYLDMTVKISKNPTFIPLLLDISKDYKPIQTQSIYTLLSLLYEGVVIFSNVLKHDKTSVIDNKSKSTEEKLANEILNTYEIVTKNIKAYKTHLDSGKNITEILKLPIPKSYPLLLRELAFDYMSMRNANGSIVHYYSSNNSGEPTNAKAIRLAQEFADLPRSLPIESTNSIYVRVDKDNMDFMKVLIMGSEGTPYSNGAFQFDVFFDSQYPSSPPKVNLMTTGNGTVRFNPNLYSNGKVCLSLLGTWRGQSTENWDPKISTLLQVLISIQSIIMSDLVYFNEPSCESEMGTPQGEAKNEAYSNIVRYCNIKFAMIEQIKNPSKGFEEVIKRHFYLKKEQIIKEVKEWVELSKKKEAKYTSFSYDHNTTWASKFNQPKNYTKMLEEIIIELEKTLNQLPLPTDLQKKAEDEKKEKMKKVEKMTFENLENVDVSYNNTNIKEINSNVKEININDDKVKDRWSRYIGAMGLEAVQRQANASIFISGMGGLGIEIAKNIVLSGCKNLTIHDTKQTNFYDLSSQFYLNENDIGKNRAECSLKKLQELNLYVKIDLNTNNLPNNFEECEKFFLNKYNCIVLTECDNKTLISIDNYCRNKNIFLVICDVYGGIGRLINDFGEKFIVNDKDGEEIKEAMLKNIEINKDLNKAKVSVLDGTRHEFVDDDLVEVNEVVGMDGINKKQFKIKVLTPETFELIGDFKDFVDKKYERNGIVRQIKQKYEIKFDSIENILNINNNKNAIEKYIDNNMSISDFTKINNGYIIHLILNALDEMKNKIDLIEPWNIETYKKIYEKIESFDKEILSSEENKKLIAIVSFTCMTQFPTLCAYFGGFAAQEIIKSITNKYYPVNQMMFQDVSEIFPNIDCKEIEESIKKFNYKNNKNRLDGLKILLGNEDLNKILNTKIMIVGAGAIGCELIKNFSMLNVGTGENGSIFITDPDIIEPSNLTRQFLFREKHIRLPKSVIAAAAAIQMNPNLKNKIFAKIDKVSEETENIFTDKFISNLNLISNALDNINARRYIDSRCVSNRIPLLESGTLGPKGHVQVIIPFKTESYSSQNDPEVSNDIPQCTLKMFPEEAIHCVEWARDQFGKMFTQLPKIVNKICDEFYNNNGDVKNDEIKLIKKTLKWIKKTPKNFDDCLILARQKFNKVFCNNIKQLLYAYPLDKKDKQGKLFWTLPKRPPKIDDFDVNDNLCIDFISAYACLMANMFNIKIPYEKPRDFNTKKEMTLKIKDVKVEDFKPNEEKLKAIEKEVEEEENKKNNNKEEENNNNNINVITNVTEDENVIKELTNILNNNKNNIKKLTSTEFEKDNDNNFHIDIIYAMSALRCRNYKLEIMDWITVKIKAGRIIPALATTTSSIAALQSLELIKVIKNLPLEQYRNSFLNLAIPYLQSSEPGVCKKVKIHEGLTTTLWDRWEINLDNDKCNIKSLFEILKAKYMLFPKDIFKGKKAVYSYNAYKDKKNVNEEIINKDLTVLLDVDKNIDEYVDLMIMFTKDENSDEYLNDIPKIRVYFQK